MRLFDEPSLVLIYITKGRFWGCIPLDVYYVINPMSHQLCHSYVNSGQNYLFKPAVKPCFTVYTNAFVGFLL